MKINQSCSIIQYLSLLQNLSVDEFYTPIKIWIVVHPAHIAVGEMRAMYTHSFRGAEMSGFHSDIPTENNHSPVFVNILELFEIQFDGSLKTPSGEIFNFPALLDAVLSLEGNVDPKPEQMFHNPEEYRELIYRLMRSQKEATDEILP